MAEEKKTLGTEIPEQPLDTTTKTSLSDAQDMTDYTKEEIGNEESRTTSESSKMKKLKLEHLITIAGKFVRGKIEAKELDEFGSKMVIRSYIPMIEKVRSLMMVIYKLDNDTLQTHEVRIANTHKTLFFDVLLGEYAMIDVSNEELKTYAAYDLLYPIFSPFLMQYCGYDYAQYKQMFDDSISVSHLNNLSEMFSSLDYKKIAEQNKKAEEIIAEIKENKELIKSLNELMTITNPQLTGTLKIIQKNLIDEATEAIKNKTSMKPLPEKTKNKIRAKAKKRKEEEEKDSVNKEL